MWLALLTLAAGGLPPFKLDLLDGRADIAGAAGVERVRPGSGLREREGPGYLETSALTRLHLRWSGAASLELGGVCALEWRESVHDEGKLRLAFAELDRCALEVRRGPLRVELPGGWLLHVDHGATFLRSLSDGTLELEHAAGAPLLVSSARGGAELTPPWTVLPGAVVRLEPGRAEPTSKDHARLLAPLASGRAALSKAQPNARPWSGFAWPWADPVGQPLAIEVSAAPIVREPERSKGEIELPARSEARGVRSLRSSAQRFDHWRGGWGGQQP